MSTITHVSHPRIQVFAPGANTEETIVLEAVARFKLKARGSTALRIAYQKGFVATGAAGTPFFTLAAGGLYEEDGLSAQSLTLYVAPAAGDYIELLTWN